MEYVHELCGYPIGRPVCVVDVRITIWDASSKARGTVMAHPAITTNATIDLCLWKFAEMNRQLVLCMRLGLFLTLAACQTTNVPAAADSFPEFPKNPDGVCPNLTGRFFPSAIPEEGRGIERELAFFNKHTKMPPIKWIRLPGGKYRAAPVEHLEIRHISPTTVEVRRQYAAMLDGDSYISVLNTNDQVCDRGTLFHQFTLSGGAEGGRKTTQTIVKTTKEPDGSIVDRFYEDQRSTFFEIVPGGTRREILTYRFKPYVEK
jgi:hypothetical protein